MNWTSNSPLKGQSRQNVATDDPRHSGKQIGNAPISPQPPHEQHKILPRGSDSLDAELRDNAVEKARRNREQRQKELARNQRMQEIAERQTQIQHLRKQADDLFGRELRLRAEVGVLQEKQQGDHLARAAHVQQLVHRKASLVEKEMAKGQADLEYIARIIATTLRAYPDKHGAGDGRQQNISSGEAVAARDWMSEVQANRHRAFEARAQELQDQLVVFEHQRENLSQQADAIRARRQRAVQILSSSHQDAIKDFFSLPVSYMAPHSTIRTTEHIASNEFAPDYAFITNQLDPRAAHVGRFQQLEDNKQSVRRQVNEALRHARSNIDNADTRLATIQQGISERMQEAKQMRIAASAVETNSPTLHSVVALIHELLFEWMEGVVDTIEQQAQQQPHQQSSEEEAVILATPQPILDAVNIHDGASALAQAVLTDIMADIISVTATEAIYDIQSLPDRAQTSTPSLSISEKPGLLRRWLPGSPPRSQATPSPTKAMGLVENAAATGADVQQLRMDTLQPFRSRPYSSSAKHTFKLLSTREITIPESFGYCNCVHVHGGGKVMAIGTTQGEILVIDLDTEQPQILRSSAKRAACEAITRVYLSSNTQQIVSLTQRGIAHVWNVSSSSNSATSTFPTDLKHFKPILLEVALEVIANELTSLRFDGKPKQKRSAANKHSSKSGVHELTCARFFDSWSLLGRQTAVLCSSSSGELLKRNLQFTSVGAAILELPQGIQAKFEPAQTGSAAGTLNSTSRIRHEMFCGHEEAVLFIASFQRMQPGRGYGTEIVTIDQAGTICVWEYNSGRFAESGWFEPVQRLHLDVEVPAKMTKSANRTSVMAFLTGSHSVEGSRPSTALNSVTGRMLQIEISHDESRVVIMLYTRTMGFETRHSDGVLRFVQFLTDTRELVQNYLEVEVVGGIPPRFALTPSVEGELDFLLLLMDNSISIYSLMTGEQVHGPTPITTSVTKVGAHAPVLNFNAISASAVTASRGNEVRVVVGSDQHSRLECYAFATSASG